MSAWLTIYCTRPAINVTEAEILADIAAADVHTDAEIWGIEDEAVVDDALSHLTIERVDDVDGIRFHLRYAGPDQVPILIWIWDGSSAAEMLNEIRDARGAGASQVRDVLQHTVAVVGLAMKASHQEDMGIVLASRIAETFASAEYGLIRDQNDEWWALENSVPLRILSRPENA